MENAGKDDIPDEAERKGLGTPATRAAIIEKLVATGFVERKRAKKAVSLVPAHTGVSLITVLPEQLQSPLLTAEWEYRLQQVERGELFPDEFMTGIADMLTELVKTYKVISGAEVLFPSGREIIGKCPRCGGDVTESKKGFFCEKNDCRFGLWRDNKFFAAKRAALTKKGRRRAACRRASEAYRPLLRKDRRHLRRHRRAGGYRRERPLPFGI